MNVLAKQRQKQKLEPFFGNQKKGKERKGKERKAKSTNRNDKLTWIDNHAMEIMNINYWWVISSDGQYTIIIGCSSYIIIFTEVKTLIIKYW